MVQLHRMYTFSAHWYAHSFYCKCTVTLIHARATWCFHHFTIDIRWNANRQVWKCLSLVIGSFTFTFNSTFRDVFVSDISISRIIRDTKERERKSADKKTWKGKHRQFKCNSHSKLNVHYIWWVIAWRAGGREEEEEKKEKRREASSREAFFGVFYYIRVLYFKSIHLENGIMEEITWRNTLRCLLPGLCMRRDMGERERKRGRAWGLMKRKKRQKWGRRCITRSASWWMILVIKMHWYTVRPQSVKCLLIEFTRSHSNSSRLCKGWCVSVTHSGDEDGRGDEDEIETERERAENKKLASINNYHGAYFRYFESRFNSLLWKEQVK